jgi:hypothetical protein
MAGKLLEIDPAALAELGSTVAWYLKRSEAAASEFVAEVDRAIGRVIESPGRWPTGEQATPQIRSAALSIRNYLPGKGDDGANPRRRSRTQTPGVLAGPDVRAADVNVTMLGVFGPQPLKGRLISKDLRHR